MEKRFLLAIFLCFLSLYAWQALVVKPVPKPAAAGAAATGSSTASTSRGTAPSTQPATPTTPTPNREAEAAPVPAANVVTEETQERTVRLETADVIAEFTNRGARLKSWRLKHY